MFASRRRVKKLENEVAALKLALVNLAIAVEAGTTEGVLKRMSAVRLGVSMNRKMSEAESVEFSKMMELLDLAFEDGREIKNRPDP